MHRASLAGARLDHKRASVQAATRAAPMLPGARVQGERAGAQAHAQARITGIDMELHACEADMLWRTLGLHGFGTPVDFNFSVGTENVYSGRLFYIFAALGISALFRLYRAKRCQG